MHIISLNEYRELIHLDNPFLVVHIVQNLNEKQLTKYRLVQEILSYFYPLIPSFLLDSEESYGKSRSELYRALIAHSPVTMPDWVYEKIDLLLQIELYEKALVNSHSLTPSTKYPKITWWQGDITTLQIDAIVNAANKQLLGCFIPFHKCIDNAIHAAAGPRLRNDCNIIMQAQGTVEPRGYAKITRGYNLPAKYILHTVGPNVSQTNPRKGSNRITENYSKQLASCYISCLELAAQIPTIQSLAFCCISTGVFGFPNDIAARLALSTVNEWMRQHPDRFDLIVFNVFTQKDMEIYRNLFQ